MKKLTAIFLAFFFAIGLPLIAHAVETSEVSEISNTETSVPESSVLESSVSEPSTEPTPSEPTSEPSEPDTSDTSVSEPIESSVEENSTENSRTPVEPSEPSEEESSQEESVITPESSQSTPSSPDVADPFGLFAGIIPNINTSSPPQNSTPEQEETSVEETTSVPEENTNIPTVDETKWLNSETAAIAQTNTTDDSDILTGIILWSVIGLAITTVFIILLNIKGNDRSSYRKNKYTSAPMQQRTAYSSRKYYR
ncbi:MAG: hypothetical protein ACI4M3_05670 [Acutalibacteraceae bacterium]